MSILKKGLAGEPVKVLQQKLGVEADGQFGPATEKALKDFQTKQGLGADGIAGPDTFAALGLYELILLKVGTSGGTVKKLQTALSLPADGKFGPATRKAVVDYQSANGLEADGFAGPATLAKLGIFSQITPETITRSQVSADRSSPPAGHPNDVAATATASGPAATAGAATGTTETVSKTDEAPARSIWSTIKSFFS